jgi:gluconolactonase
VWIISPEGKHLGIIITPRHPHNLAWGDDDYRTLYMASQSELYRMRLNIPGVRPALRADSEPLPAVVSAP